MRRHARKITIPSPHHFALTNRKFYLFSLVVLWVLNTFSWHKKILSISRLWDSRESSIFRAPDSGASGDPTSGNRMKEDTAVVITSSWIPSHPSTYMVETVLNSTTRLLGLSPSAPVIITVDQFKLNNFGRDAQEMQERLNALERYTDNLFRLYTLNPRIHVVPAMRHLHIGGNVVKAMRMISRHYPSVEYMYYLQHDFPFFRDTDHAALINAMKEHGKINYIRFPKNAKRSPCKIEQPITYNRTHVLTHNGTRSNALWLSPTQLYSDNNHLVRLKWNMQVMKSLVSWDRAPEGPLMNRAFQGCAGQGKPGDLNGLYLYHEVNIRHLDGRQHNKSAQ